MPVGYLPSAMSVHGRGAGGGAQIAHPQPGGRRDGGGTVGTAGQYNPSELGKPAIKSRRAKPRGIFLPRAGTRLARPATGRARAQKLFLFPLTFSSQNVLYYYKGNIRPTLYRKKKRKEKTRHVPSWGICCEKRLRRLPRERGDLPGRPAVLYLSPSLRPGRQALRYVPVDLSHTLLRDVLTAEDAWRTIQSIPSIEGIPSKTTRTGNAPTKTPCTAAAP